MVLALQGGMAVGKTTAARYTAAHASAVTVFFEDNAPALAALRGRGLDKHKFADYCEIQRAFIQQELDRYALAAHCPCALLDLGPQEIEFYTLYYPPHPWAGLARGTGTGGRVGLPAPLSHQPHAVFACVRSCSTAAQRSRRHPRPRIF